MLQDIQKRLVRLATPRLPAARFSVTAQKLLYTAKLKVKVRGSVAVAN